MSATSLTFQVTDTSSGTTSDISAIDIVLVTASGSGSKINYMKDGEVPIQLIVTESPSTVSTAAKYLIPLTDTATSAVFYVNIDNIHNVFTNGSAAKVQYDMKLAEDVTFAVNETRAAIRTLIAGVVSAGGGGSVVTGLTAGATQTQAGATALSYGFNEVTTVTTAGDGVRLPAGVIGAQVTVLNDGANIMQVYPATGGKINDGSVNASVNQSPGVEVMYENVDGTNWESSGQGQSVYTAQVTLTNAQVLALNGTAIPIVTAAKAGLTSNKIIMPITATMAYTYVAAYATNTELDLIHSGSSNALLKTDISAAANTFSPFVTAVSATPTGNVFIANADLNVFVPTGNPTGGNAGNSIKVTVFYTIMDVL